MNNEHLPSLCITSAIACFVIANCAPANAIPITWNFDIATTGQSVTWNSPTAVDPASPEYDYTYTVTRVDATVQYSIFPPTTIDVTSQIPPEFLSSGGTLAGPPPITLVDQSLQFPLPPQPIAIAGHVTTTIDAAGFGHVSITDVQFGTYQVNLPPFGTVTVNIRGVRVIGNVTVRPIYTGDLDRDGDVDLQDLASVLATFGACNGDPTYNPFADFDGDACVTLQDLANLLANFGRA